MPRQRTHRSTISLSPKLRDRLEARGARSDKGHGPYNYTRQLGRTLELYDSVLIKSDPRQTRDMLNAFPYAEKLHLTDAAQVRNAPPRASAAPATAATTAPSAPPSPTATSTPAGARTRRKAR